MSTSGSPRQRFCLSVAGAVSAERVQFQLHSLCAEDSVHPADGFLVAEIVAYCRDIDQVNSVVLAERVFVRVPINDGLHLFLWPDQVEESFNVQEIAVAISQRVVHEEDRRPSVRTLQVA